MYSQKVNPANEVIFYAILCFFRDYTKSAFCGPLWALVQILLNQRVETHSLSSYVTLYYHPPFSFVFWTLVNKDVQGVAVYIKIINFECHKMRWGVVGTLSQGFPDWLLPSLHSPCAPLPPASRASVGEKGEWRVYSLLVSTVWCWCTGRDGTLGRETGLRVEYSQWGLLIGCGAWE